MNFNTILDLSWIVIAAIALGTLGLLEWQVRRAESKAACWRRAMAVLVAVVLLFPCVSASDDLLWFRALPLQSGSGRTGAPQSNRADQKATFHFVRLLEDLGNVQISGVYSLSFTPCFFSLLRSRVCVACGRRLPVQTGRDPPASLLLG